MSKEKADAAVACCKETVVKLEPTLALVCLILNIIWPGFGTMISACAGEKFQCNTLCHGVLQNLTAIVIVGWIWSIMQGLWIYRASK